MVPARWKPLGTIHRSTHSPTTPDLAAEFRAATSAGPGQSRNGPAGGRGADTITFKENAAIKGKNEFFLGKGKDVLKLPGNKESNGSVVIKGLQGFDKAKVGNEIHKGQDIIDGKVTLPDYINFEIME